MISKLNMEWKQKLSYFEAISFYDFSKQMMNFAEVIIHDLKLHSIFLVAG